MFHATCDCGRVKIEVAERPSQVTICNCSICRRTGAIYAYGKRPDFRLVEPEFEALDIYSTGNHRLVFYRCSHCGCHVFHEHARKSGDETIVGFNTRMLAPEVIRGLPVRYLNGAGDWSERFTDGSELYL